MTGNFRNRVVRVRVRAQPLSDAQLAEWRRRLQEMNGELPDEVVPAYAESVRLLRLALEGLT